MAGLEEVIKTATDGGNCCTSTPQARPSPRARKKESGDGSGISRTWTRSQSPLRQLLSASNSRPSSPRNNSTQGGRCDGDRPAPAVVAEVAAQASTTLSFDSGEPVLQQQQQRVCLKNVLHPVCYDECHTPTEEEQAGGDGDDGYDNSDNSNAASGAAVSADGVVSVS